MSGNVKLWAGGRGKFLKKSAGPRRADMSEEKSVISFQGVLELKWNPP
jgi:hypothetical protein